MESSGCKSRTAKASTQAGSECCHSPGDWWVRSVHSKEAGREDSAPKTRLIAMPRRGEQVHVSGERKHRRGSDLDTLWRNSRRPSTPSSGATTSTTGYRRSPLRSLLLGEMFGNPTLQ